MRTRFCETIFWGKDSQNLGYYFQKEFLNVDSASQKGVWGMNAGRNFLVFWVNGQLEKISIK
jgi:hypothetical protein